MAENTTVGQSQPTPTLIVAQTGAVHCFNNEYTRVGGKTTRRVDVKRAGRLLDDRECNEVPAC